MAENRLNDSVQSLLNGLDGFLSTKMVIGEPISVNGTMILPLMDVQIGVGAGTYAGKNNSTAGGLGAKIAPNAVLIVQDGAVKIVSAKNQDNVTRVLDMVPGIIEKLSGKFVKSSPEVDEKVEEILN